MLRPLIRTLIQRMILPVALLVVGKTVDAKNGNTTLDELLSVQKSVQAALPTVRPALVALANDDGRASGVIVSPNGLVLTAAHVANDLEKEATPGRRLKVYLANGKMTMATSLGMDMTTDAAMLQLDGVRHDWPFVPLLRGGVDVRVGEWCFALGHPGGPDAERGDVLRMGKVIKIAPNNLQSDCVLMGGDSGGPLFNLDGELIGIHSQIWEGRDQNVHVALAPFLRSWDAMKDGHVIRVWERGAGGWLGVATRELGDSVVEVDQVAPESPAARAGLRSGDRLISLDKRAVQTSAGFSAALEARAAGDTVVLVVQNHSGQRIVTVKLKQRPKD